MFTANALENRTHSVLVYLLLIVLECTLVEEHICCTKTVLILLGLPIGRLMQISVVVEADVAARSPRKLLIGIVQNKFVRNKVCHKHLICFRK